MGMIYALMAMGIIILVRAIGLLNFAQGDFLMLGSNTGGADQLCAGRTYIYASYLFPAEKSQLSSGDGNCYNRYVYCAERVSDSDLGQLAAPYGSDS